MALRKRTRPGTDRKVFRGTANRTKAINIIPTAPRGGQRL